jgi:hypothetical protein
MLSPEKMYVFVKAYMDKLGKGQLLEDIDKHYKEVKGVKDEDITRIHERLILTGVISNNA